MCPSSVVRHPSKISRQRKETGLSPCVRHPSPVVRHFRIAACSDSIRQKFFDGRIHREYAINIQGIRHCTRLQEARGCTHCQLYEWLQDLTAVVYVVHNAEEGKYFRHLPGTTDRTGKTKSLSVLSNSEHPQRCRHGGEASADGLWWTTPPWLVSRLKDPTLVGRFVQIRPCSTYTTTHQFIVIMYHL